MIINLIIKIEIKRNWLKVRLIDWFKRDFK